MIFIVVFLYSAYAAESDIPSLSEVYKKYFPIGTAVEPYQLKGNEGKLVNSQFSSLTAENKMKPQYIEPIEGLFQFEEADSIVDFALANKKLIRGHNLVWHQQYPRWIFSGTGGNPASRDLLLKRMETYIKKVVGRYKGKIYAWDVVNEAVDPAEYDGMRKSDWFNIIGPDYIDKAFQFAHEADPDAKLFINDYNTTENLKGSLFYNLIKKLKDKGVPINGIGMQFHITKDYPGLQEIKDSINKFRSLGLEIHITELDMSINNNPAVTDASEDLLILQANRYKEIMEIFKLNSDIIRNVTFWGFQDGHTWLASPPFSKMDWPLLFDRNLQPKYAFWALADPSKLPRQKSLMKSDVKVALAKKGTPVINGSEDSIWKNAGEIKTDIFVGAVSGSRATAKMLWDEKNIYILAMVTGTNLSSANKDPWEQDSFEVFIDEMNHRSGEYGKDDAQYRVNYKNEQSFGGSPAKIQSAAKIIDGGYIIEIAVPFRFVKPSPDVEIGFEIQVNGTGGTGQRVSIAKWNDPSNESYRNTSGFGILKLAE